ncbi:ABC transporter ATP-binding protein [Enteractinococcus coprophilus]|uniref:Peptide/nickel transport system ATP-binding protein n=1 Tax=Enteractinococcus coprophilus TaxID=1027633 RepID=A0A543AGB0_9MICC|nr:ATP-binding cassette domain-containing protein [Enteractinococcus coprophilus]TQL71597.1 peptide/nickel transport system ATP-binding protein [Enteractinococcus coprophilus]
MTTQNPVLTIQKLRVATDDGEILHGIDLELYRGEILGLIGDAGSGKTTVGLACLGYFRNGLHYVSGRVIINPVDGTEPFYLFDQDAETLRSLRGRRLAYVPADPAMALNPTMRVGDQIHEVLTVHHYADDDAKCRARVDQVLDEAGLPHDEAFQHQWPHELSGDQPHRVALAMAFALTPDVVVFDEPTGSLDVLPQARVLDTFRRLTIIHNAASLYITHDPAVAASLAHRVMVIHRGEIVDTDAREGLLTDLDRYSSRSLVSAVSEPTRDHALETSVESPSASVLTIDEPVHLDRATGEREHLIAVDDLAVSYREHTVLDRIDLGVEAGECTFIFGETGAGKTTLARSIAGLLPRYKGTVTLRGKTLARKIRRRSLTDRQDLQYIFPSPSASLNPHHTLGQSLSVPLDASGRLPVEQRRVVVEETLEAVQLDSSFYNRRPAEVSKEQLQRAAIARALVAAPSVLVCDDITTDLDVSAQASIITLLNSLRESRGLTILFLARDIRLARHVANRLAVLHHGQIVEHGTVDDVLENPNHSYTETVLANVMEL